MKITVFQISHMDCSSEEQLIRLKLADFSNILSLQFDIPNRKLSIHHTGDYDPIFAALETLKLGASFVSTDETSVNDLPHSMKQERTVLIQALAINSFFFVLEIISGFLSSSMGLVADSLDMFADALVLGMSLFVIGGTIAKKKLIAKIAGYFQLMLAALGVSEIVRRFVSTTEVPVFQTMVLISILALAGNAISLFLLQKAKSKDAHIKASVIFLSNDVIINIGVIIAGILVFITKTKYPDLIVGAVVYSLVGYGAMRIFKLSK